jgi:short subunit dehydrogenase-like uncharacterized protein
VASALQIASSGEKERFDDPFLLAPETRRAPRPLELDPTKALYDPDVQTWTAPFMMGPINTRVVRRSCALLGRDFAYQEFSKSRNSLEARASAALGRALSRIMNTNSGRGMLKRFAPAPGTGPTEAAMDAGWFRCEFFARSADGRTVRGLVSGKGDAANRITVKCVCEAALSLACDSNRLPDRAGVLTPATGIGLVLEERLTKPPLSLTFYISRP